MKQIKNPNWKEVNQLAIFTSVVKDLKSGLTENESSEQWEQDMNSRLQVSRGLQITSPWAHFSQNLF